MMPIAGYVEGGYGDAPDTPSDAGRIYWKTDGKAYGKNAAGTEYDLTASGGGGDVAADTLTLNDGSELTIASGAVTATHAWHTVDTESDAASDDLDTVNGLSAGEICLITANNTARTVNITNGVGNISTATGSTISLDDDLKAVLLMGDTAGTGVIAYPLQSSGGGGGETNTASNVGTAGVGVFKQKTGVDLEFKQIDGNAGISVTDDTGDDEVGIALDIDGLTAESTIDAVNDTVAFFDQSVDSNAGALRKTAIENLPFTQKPGSSTDNAIPRFNGVDGDTLQDSGVTIDDNNRLILPDDATYPPLNMTQRSAAPSDPAVGDVYLDDGTNTASGSPGFRRAESIDPDVWEDIGAVSGGGGGTPNFGAPATKTLSGDDVAAGSDRNLVIAAESGTADNLHEITGLSVGDKVLLTADTGDDITVVHNEAAATMKILTLSGEDITLPEDYPLEFVVMSASALVQVRPASLPSASYTLNEGSDYTTTSSTFVDVDATNLSLPIETHGGDIEIGFHGVVNSGAGQGVYFDVDLDGARIAGDDGITGTKTASIDDVPVGFTRRVSGVAPGSHTVKLQWKRFGGTATLYAGAGTANADYHPQFWVREVS